MIRIIPLLAVLVATSATAQTPATKAELPDEMLHAWCNPNHDYEFPDDDGDQLRRAEDSVEDCANRGGLDVRKSGYDYYRFGIQATCKYVAIEFSRHSGPADHLRPVLRHPEEIFPAPNTPPPGDVYLVHATCEGEDEWNEGKTWGEIYEIQITDGWLVRRFLDEG